MYFEQPSGDRYARICLQLPDDIEVVAPFDGVANINTSTPGKTGFLFRHDDPNTLAYMISGDIVPADGKAVSTAGFTIGIQYAAGDILGRTKRSGFVSPYPLLDKCTVVMSALASTALTREGKVAEAPDELEKLFPAAFRRGSIGTVKVTPATPTVLPPKYGGSPP